MADDLTVDIVCGSRELFGADRCALRLACVMRDLGLRPTILVPRSRPERGLGNEAARLQVGYAEAPIAVVSRRGLDDWHAARPRRRAESPAMTILNSTAVVGPPRQGRRTLLVVREWLEPRSPRHRLLAAWHRARTDIVAGVSNQVLAQWNACVRGPARQFLDPGWLAPELIRVAEETRARGVKREGILFMGRFNRWKGQDVLADAYEMAFAKLATRPSMTFLGAQPGTEFGQFAQRLTRRGEPWGWRILPFSRDPSAQLGAAALTVVPSLRPEPFGLVVLEALAMGSRVLTFEGGGPDDLRARFGAPLAVVERSTDALAQALRGWWEAGGASQDAAMWTNTMRVIDAEYSHAAALARWRSALPELSNRDQVGRKSPTEAGRKPPTKRSTSA